LPRIRIIKSKRSIYITEIRKNINIRKGEIKEVSQQIELHTKQEILLLPPLLRVKTKEEIEDEIGTDLLRFKY
jgi:hypothetical protein